ncbi:hypothetical protein [Streptomyces sp. NPDC004435]|uniref:hypothetical protein n=1 Tax=Streptomyces sp. NPDC004435 TaxID=3364701 RepID=UPI0036761261
MTGEAACRRGDGVTARSLECAALGDSVAGLSAAEWNLPPRRSVRELRGHVCVVIDWLPAVLDAPEPGEAEISAAEYYRPDDRFSPQANGKRIALAQDRAASRPTAPPAPRTSPRHGGGPPAARGPASRDMR